MLDSRSRRQVDREATALASEGARIVDPHLATAEEAFAASRSARSPFERDRLYDDVTTAMARACGETLWRYCVGRHRVDSTRAEDLTQQALLAFRQALPTFEGRSSLKTLLYAIASNVCRAHIARESRRGAILAADADTVAELLHNRVDGDAEARLAQERLNALEQALDTLPAREVFLVRARLGEGLGYDQILPRFQARFGTGIQTVEGLRTLFFHVKKRLMRQLRRGP